MGRETSRWGSIYAGNSRFGDISRRSEDANNQFRVDSLDGFTLSFENHHNPYAYTTDSTGQIPEIVPN